MASAASLRDALTRLAETLIIGAASGAVLGLAHFPAVGSPARSSRSPQRAAAPADAGPQWRSYGWGEHIGPAPRAAGWRCRRVPRPKAEAFVADGYGNRRAIVFDAGTDAYKRHWGAYSNKPDGSNWLKCRQMSHPRRQAKKATTDAKAAAT
jgi:hypothetical protein